MAYQVKPLTRELTGVYLEQFLIMDQVEGGEVWERRHFLHELPGKWECSWIALEADEAVGFVIASLKSHGLHVHRIVVHSEHRRRGLGRILLQRAAERAVERGLPQLTLRVPEQNRGAVAFYHRLGFQQQDRQAGHLELAIDPRRLLHGSHDS